MTVAEIQRALLAPGFDPGPIDGKKGRKTTDAIKAFQVANGLGVDGKLGPISSAALFPKSVPTRTDDLPTFPPAAIEPEVRPTATHWPRQRDCMTFYGGVGLHQASLRLPFPMRLAWDKGVIVNKITVHQKVHDCAARAFQHRLGL